MVDVLTRYHNMKAIEEAQALRAEAQPGLDILADQYPRLHFNALILKRGVTLVVQALNADGSLGDLIDYRLRLADPNLHAKLAQYNREQVNESADGEKS